MRAVCHAWMKLGVLLLHAAAGFEVAARPPALHQQAAHRRRSPPKLPASSAWGTRPVMGWGSYYGYEHDGKTQSVNERMIKGQADLLVSTGLAKAGFRMIMPDDGGYFKRNAATGRLNETTEQFPSGFKAVGDYVHSKGLFWGVYSDSGTRTCGPGTGMLGHEAEDAASFASWGVDHLKVDNCAVPDMDQPPQVRYKKIGDALKQSGRKIVLNMCEWGLNNPAEWGPWAGATSWRVSGDIKWGRYGNFFQSMLWEIKTANVFADLAGPGRYNDPDELQIGVRACEDAAARAQFMLWALAKAPLILSAPLAQGSERAKFGSDEPGLCAKDLQLVTNPEIIAVSQDPLSLQGRLLHTVATTPVAVKPFGKITSGTYAPLAFLPEQLFIPRNDGRIIAGDGRCLSTDGQTASVAPCGSNSLGQYFVGAFVNTTNLGTALNVSIESVKHSGKCLQSQGGSGVLLVACDKSNERQRWFVDQHESFIHPQASTGSKPNSGTHALSIAEPISRREVWAGALVDGSVAVVLFNSEHNGTSHNITVDISALPGFNGSACVSARNLVKRQDMGVHCGSIGMVVQPRGAQMLRLNFTDSRLRGRFVGI